MERKGNSMKIASHLLIGVSLATMLVSALTMSESMAGKGSAARILAGKGGGTSIMLLVQPSIVSTPATI